MNLNLANLTTEKQNVKTKNLDQLKTSEIIKLMNQEDSSVPLAVSEVIPNIEEAVEAIVSRLKVGGRLFYIGAGTSGRLGVLDASECPPTFFTPPEMVQGIIAGGEKAMFTAIEGAEDSVLGGADDLKERNLSENDVVVGITASGRTPYVVGALNYANQIGAETISLSCNENSEVGKIAKHKIEVVVGPEVIAGSTRLKAGTAQKLVLNMLSTASMIKLGKVYDNLMVDLNASNSKLVERAKGIVMNITNVSYEVATDVLNQTNQRVKPAIIMIIANVSVQEALNLLDQAEGNVRDALSIVKI